MMIQYYDDVEEANTEWNKALFMGDARAPLDHRGIQHGKALR